MDSLPKYDPQAEGLISYRSIKIVKAARVARMKKPGLVVVETPVGDRDIHYNPREKLIPKEGWWVVFYPDGYISFSPPQPFVQGYIEVNH